MIGEPKGSGWNTRIDKLEKFMKQKSENPRNTFDKFPKFNFSLFTCPQNAKMVVKV